MSDMPSRRRLGCWLLILGFFLFMGIVIALSDMAVAG